MSVKLPHKRFRSSLNPNKIERKFYKVWSEMNRRCRTKTSEKNNRAYFYKKIRVYDRWHNFDYFFIDMWDLYLLHRNINDGDTELDRIDNSKGYSKNNCRWVTREENMNNTDVVRKINGKTLAEWSKITGVKHETLAARLEKGWPGKKVLNYKFGSKPGVREYHERNRRNDKPT